jgi:hypothetical protein
MASKATNDAVARLRGQQAARKQELGRRHAAQNRALAAVSAQQAAVEAAEDERAAVTARLNAAVAAARTGRDVAVAVLAHLSSVEDAAELVGPSATEVRRCVQRAPKAAVDSQAEQMLEGGQRRRARVASARVAGGGLLRSQPEPRREGDQSGGAGRGGEAE